MPPKNRRLSSFFDLPSLASAGGGVLRRFYHHPLLHPDAGGGGAAGSAADTGGDSGDAGGGEGDAGGKSGDSEGGGKSGGADLLGDGGAATKPPAGAVDPANWRASLGEEFRDHPSLAPLKTLDDVAKRLVHAESMVGADKVALPGKNATPEQVAEFRKKLGVPDDPSGYELPKQGMPEGFAADDKRLEAMRKAAHEAGIPATAFAQMARAEAEFTDRAMKQLSADLESRRQGWVQSLRADPAFGGQAFEQNVREAENAAREFGGQELLDTLKDNGLQGNPVIVKALHKAGKMLLDDEILGQGSKRAVVMSPAAAQKRIGELKSDEKFSTAYYNADEPGHEAAKAEMDKLAAMAWPEETDDS